MEFTGERYIPELKSAKISYEHWHRYIFARRFCTQKTVLDVACGEGYGSSYLSAFAKEVTGIDISDESVTHAKNKYTGSNIHFLQSNATKLPFPESNFDVIVSFETLEHLTAEDQRLFLAESARVLNDKGIMIVSTPNKKIYSDDPQYTNPYHLAEFYRADFETFLLEFYKTVIIFNQQVVGGSQICRPNVDQYDIDYIHMGAEGFVPGLAENHVLDTEYLIAVCSQTAASPISGSLMLDNHNQLIIDLTNQNK